MRAAAYDALAGVTSPKDFNRLCDLLDKAQEADVKALQAGLKNALAQETPSAQYEKTMARISSAPVKARYLTPCWRRPPTRRPLRPCCPPPTAKRPSRPC